MCLKKLWGLELVMLANNTGEVIESDQYGEAVFHAVDDNMDDQDLVWQMDEVIQTRWKR